MEQHPSSIFEMQMDNTAQGHLLSISKWGKFISITGFVIGALFLLLFAARGEQIVEQVSALLTLGNGGLAGALIAIVIVVLALVGAWVFFLFRACSLIRRGLQSKNTADLSEGFKSMRIYFVFSMIMSLLTILGTLSNLLMN